MKLKRVARFFDRTAVHDPDTGAYLFRCQINNYDGSHRDAHAAYRRILSVAPGTTLPDSGTVRIFGENWLVSASMPMFDGLREIHRQRHVMQLSTGKVEIYSLSEYLASAQPKTAWADVQWVVGTKEKDYSSDSPQVYDVYFPVNHHLPPHHLIKHGGYVYLGQFQYDSAAGFTVYRTLRQEAGAVQLVEIITRRHNPATGRSEETSTSDVPCLAVRWQEFFEYTDEMSTKFTTGDRVFLLPAGTAVSSQSRLRAQGRLWSVQAIQPADGVLSIHARPA